MPETIVKQTLPTSKTTYICQNFDLCTSTLSRLASNTNTDTNFVTSKFPDFPVRLCVKIAQNAWDWRAINVIDVTPQLTLVNMVFGN